MYAIFLSFIDKSIVLNGHTYFYTYAQILLGTFSFSFVKKLTFTISNKINYGVLIVQLKKKF